MASSKLFIREADIEIGSPKDSGIFSMNRATASITLATGPEPSFITSAAARRLGCTVLGVRSADASFRDGATTAIFDVIGQVNIFFQLLTHFETCTFLVVPDGSIGIDMILGYVSLKKLGMEISPGVGMTPGELRPGEEDSVHDPVVLFSTSMEVSLVSKEWAAASGRTISAVPDGYRYKYTDLISGICYDLHGRISYPLPNDPNFGFFIADINRHIIIGLDGFMGINATLDFPSGSISWKPLPKRFPVSGPTCTRCSRGHVLSKCPVFFCSGKEGTWVIELTDSSASSSDSNCSSSSSD